MHQSPQVDPNRKIIAKPLHQAISPGQEKVEIITPRNLIVYLAVVQGMVQVSGPFFTPYMLKHLELSYMHFATLIATAFIAKIIALASWGKFAKRQGAQWLLLLGGCLIIPLSSLWIVSANFYWLMAVQAVSGVAWAAYELGFFLMLFDSVPIVRRVRLLTIYNVANTSAWCAGALVGGTILSSIGVSSGAYFTLFAISSVGRAGALLFLITCCRDASSKLQQQGLRLWQLPGRAAKARSAVIRKRSKRSESSDLAA